MISLDLAKKLKNAGLDWEPKGHDCCALNDMEWLFGSLPEDFRRFSNWDKLIWLPSLSQLLAEINKSKLPLKRLYHFNRSWTVNLWASEPLSFTADSPEEAAGKALLYLLEQEEK